VTSRARTRTARASSIARARIEEVGLRGVPAGFRLLPGMTVTGEVKAGRRNVLMYFLHPLLRGVDESLREP
jgi:HlyD family secretion protein